MKAILLCDPVFGHLGDCPVWWQKFLLWSVHTYGDSIAGAPADKVDLELAKYFAILNREDKTISFESEEDFVRFSLEWS